MPNNEALKVIREFAGLSQCGAARLLGVHPTTWAKRELGAYPIPDGFLGEVRAAFAPIIRERTYAVSIKREVAA